MEILIGLTLMSILLAFLFTSMTRSAQFETKIEAARGALVQRQHLQARLQDIFLSIRDSSLYTKRLPGDKTESLIAIFDHGIDPDPDFSVPILARIYLDANQNLSLALWPLEKEKKKRPWRNEILLSNVDEFQFHLLGKKTEPGNAPVNAKLAWYNKWPQKRLENPSMIRLMIRQNGVPLNYAFFTPDQESFVTYWEEGYRS